MPTLLFRLCLALAAVWCVLMLVPVNDAGSDETDLTDSMIEDAFATIGLLIGRDLSTDDRSWLRRRWVAEAIDQPERTVAGLEALAVARQGIEAGTDPLALAQLRTRMIDETYCATKRSGDPATLRLQSILAPDDLVLVADCVTGVVVTPFDVKALARSNALVGDLVGSPVDVAAVEAEMLDALPDGFAGAALEARQRLLWGELRAASLNVLWSSVDGPTRKKLKAAAQDTFKGNGDVAATALAFEKSALKKVGDVRALARAGAQSFRPSEMATYIEYMEFVTGASISPSERTAITAMFVTNFHEDPGKTVKIAANLRYWLDKGRFFGKDPATGKIRSWTAAEQKQARAKEAALLFCHNDKGGDPDGKRLIEIFFRHDPATVSDCANARITRESDEVLVEAGTRQLTRGALDAHRRAFELIFALRFSADERRWFDEATLADMRNGSVGLTQAVDGFQRIVGEIRKRAHIGPHLNEQWREDYAIRIYCANKDAEDRDVARLVEIINDHDPILFEDCDRPVVVRDSDINGLVSSLNFIASLGGFDPLRENDIKALVERLKPGFSSATGGPLWYRSTQAKFSYWWSRMPVEIRHRVAAAVKKEVASRDDVHAYSSTLSQRAGFQLAKLALCNFQILKLAYNTKRIGLASRAIFNTNPNAGSPWVNPEAIDDDAAFYGVMAPFIREQCGNVWK